MNEYQWFLILAPVATVSCLVALGFSLAARPRRLVTLPGFLAACVLLLTGQVLETASSTPGRVLLFSRLTYTVVAFLPVLWFLFCREFTGGRRRSLWVWALALVPVPLLTTAFVWFEPLHPQLWADHGFRTDGAFVINVVNRYGPWFWVHCTYSYGLYLVGFAAIVLEYFHHHRLYRRQAFWVLVGSAVPLAINLVYVFRLFGPMVKDGSSLAFAVSGLLFTWGIRQDSLVRLRPPRRRDLWDGTGAIVLVLDDLKRVVDFNRAAGDQLPDRGESLLGRPLGAWLDGLEGDFPSPGDLGAGRRVRWTREDRESEGELRARPLSRSGDDRPTGYLVTIESARGEPVSGVGLSRKEQAVLALVVQELSNKEIAQRLNISESTVKSHVHRLLKKAGVRQRRELCDRGHTTASW